MRGEDRRVGQTFESLPPKQRARRYREMADAALLKLKHLNDPAAAADYLNLATAWHALAQEIESDINNLAQTEESLERLRQVAAKTHPVTSRDRN